MDEAALRRSMMRITHEIIEKNNGAGDVVLLGIRRRGIPLAKMLQDNFARLGETGIPVGSIDISLYRDDLSIMADQPVTGESEIPCDINGRTVILVDDVIYTGRTVRAAIEAVFHFGRPRSIQLAVLIDRGHRELPIRPDYVGKNVPTSLLEMISVQLTEIDGQDQVVLCEEVK